MAVWHLYWPIYLLYLLVCFRRNKKKKSVSKLVTDWKTWPKCVCVCVFFFSMFVCLFFPFSRCGKFESVTTFGVQYPIWNWIFEWTRYKIKVNQSTELKKSVAQCVSLCPSYLFLNMLTAKFIKTGKKNKQPKNFKSLDFAESNAHCKTNVRGSFET